VLEIIEFWTSYLEKREKEIVIERIMNEWLIRLENEPGESLDWRNISMEIREHADVSGCILKYEDDEAGSLKIVKVPAQVQIERI